MAELRLDVGEARAGRRTGNADEMVAARTLNLPVGVARIAFQRLVAVGTVEFEFVRGHHPFMRQTVAVSMCGKFNTFGRPPAHIETAEPVIHAIASGT